MDEGRVVRTKADYALLWANGMTFGEIYDLMAADIHAGPFEFEDGAEVRYDNALGIVRGRVASDRELTDDYMVEWRNGTTTLVWGSDLVRV